MANQVHKQRQQHEVVHQQEEQQEQRQRNVNYSSDDDYDSDNDNEPELAFETTTTRKKFVNRVTGIGGAGTSVAIDTTDTLTDRVMKRNLQRYNLETTRGSNDPVILAKQNVRLARIFAAGSAQLLYRAPAAIFMPSLREDVADTAKVMAGCIGKGVVNTTKMAGMTAVNLVKGTASLAAFPIASLFQGVRGLYRMIRGRKAPEEEGSISGRLFRSAYANLLGPIRNLMSIPLRAIATVASPFYTIAKSILALGFKLTVENIGKLADNIQFLWGKHKISKEYDPQRAEIREEYEQDIARIKEEFDQEIAQIRQIADKDEREAQLKAKEKEKKETLAERAEQKKNELDRINEQVRDQAEKEVKVDNFVGNAVHAIGKYFFYVNGTKTEITKRHRVTFWQSPSISRGKEADYGWFMKLCTLFNGLNVGQIRPLTEKEHMMCAEIMYNLEGVDGGKVIKDFDNSEVKEQRHNWFVNIFKRIGDQGWISLVTGGDMGKWGIAPRRNDIYGTNRNEAVDYNNMQQI
ncbi:MAG: hypothetical protein II800_01590 [Lachnospiraceae bacterium]|nr:hypothetical protein [Lachnospiraceae bacterium]